MTTSANNGVITREQLVWVDNVVKTPKTQELTALTMFKTFQVPAWTPAVRYKVMTTSGQASTYVEGATDIPVVDENMTEYSANLTDLAISIRYTRQQIGEARQAGVDILTPMAARARRALAEAENKLIFNGNHSSNPALNIWGLTDSANKLGVQTATAPVAFDDLGEDTDKNLQIRNWFKAALSQITHLAGYSTAKPILALPQASIDALDTPFNQYNPQMTVLEMIKPWFSQIKVVPEFEHQYFGAKGNKQDMGYIFLNSEDIVKIPVAQQVTQLQQEVHNGSTTIPYVERMGGLVMYYPHAFVQLKGINDPKKVK
ncbi:DUF2184 domain-containing protein [Lactobacillus xujianguonis]|uniref:DUF2184 domain-containing protein n=1 Tax=Lactobacillus xujianguonis TaxID=2495899 RepID=A0A437STI8_9LACO|nr:major capsid family protein [Lactobacillus xujianguonis]RVU70167.1 DUF2184 domain-containing protein [Lactobacillus xujianguonis]RVU73528.1 DUF2184 domain-containing protein [Lactobacillus xujianguonis]